MFKNELRPYEISLWTLQDGFITVLKPIGIFNKGQIETPNCTIKNDGTQELKFSIPMYYYEDGSLIENPIWYNTINGSLIVNLRKLKVIFNKGEEEEEVFEFVINEVTETHTNGQLRCEISAEGLAFQELGKVGYKISLNEQDYLDDYNEWYELEDKKGKAEPINNIDYWCEKIFKNSDWDYKIQMDWSAFDGIIDKIPDDDRESKGLRRTDRIYEEEYIASWEEVGDSLSPSRMESFKEKLRLINLEKSNRYNLTQEIAKTFGVYCKYKYEYDSNYHIIGRKCIFYNNYLAEQEGKIDITYPYNTSKIERKMDGSDIVTKMYVTPLEDTTSPSGLITIADVSANKSKEDYILNFDYLYTIGTINKEQYDYLDDYERSMFLINNELEPIAVQLANLDNDLVVARAQETHAREAQTQDKDQMTQAKQAYDNIIDNESFLVKNKDNPLRGVLLEDTDGKYYVNITLEGIDYEGENEYLLEYSSEEKVKGLRYFYYKYVDNYTKETILMPYECNTIEKEIKDGNLVRLKGLELKTDAVSASIFITCAYSPRLHYQNIYEYYAKKLFDDETLEKEAIEQIKLLEEKQGKLKERYNELLDQKTLYITELENMMGPALREGSWQAETYTDYGSKYEEKIQIGNSSTSSSHLNFLWDEELFEEEQLLYYPDSGAADGKTFYYAINLSDKISTKEFNENLSKISLSFDRRDNLNNFIDTYYYTIGSQLKYAFIKENGEIKPLLLITDKNFKKEEQGEYSHTNFKIGLLSVEILSENDEFNIQENFQEIFTIGDKDWINNLLNKTQVYPRIKSRSLYLKISEDELILKYGNESLRNYYDYSVLIRGDSYFITLKDLIVLKDGNINKTLDVAYAISNAATSLYLDALEVSRTNAAPQVSYTLEISAMSKDFIKTAYNKLNRIVEINDSDLKFENVQGYITELNLDLDNPWQDKITIQNYKTKFEDLFSTIVASSEQMKVNSFAYDNAASSFGPGGILKPSILQNTINKTDLTYEFQKGNLTIDEVNGIWARSDSGVVAMRGGGIFCATEQDTNGNWLWNTGIMPSGINASLITAGQLDTNLIKIFAGDNLRLQLNADGLFAYKTNSIGEADQNNYVVHNSEGLFLVEPKKDSTETELINKVEVSWDGLILRNNNNETVFKADEKGDLKITGTITAAEGYIGDWLIQNGGLVTETGSAGIFPRIVLNDEGQPAYGQASEAMIWINGINGNEFRVTKDGTLYCSDAIIKGTVSAGSFIGNTQVGEIDEQLRNIDIVPLDGSSYSFSNREYDGNITVEPEVLKFKINTNALTPEELTFSNLEDEELNNYSFWWGVSEDNMEQLVPEQHEKYLIWEPKYLTFRIMSDIMYLGLEELSIPNTALYFKIQKKGRKREVNSETGEINLIGTKDNPYLYESTILITSELFGLNKYLSPISPPSFTFIESNDIDFVSEKEKTFNIEAIGFTKDELEKGCWYINNEIDEEINTSITEKEENKYIISVTIPFEKVPSGGNISISYKIDYTSRNCFCFKNQKGTDAVTISLMSSSGDTLASGDTETELSVIIRYGAQVVNHEDNRGKFFYVWKKDGVPLTSFIDKNSIEVSRPEIFYRDKIRVDINDFGMKSNYECHVFTSLEEAEYESK